MDAHNRKDCQTSYDLVADEYVRRIFDELQHKPLDRAAAALIILPVGC